jgi:hypothetical protein
MSLLSPVLYNAPVIDRTTGLLTRPWQQFFAALEQRVGGAVAPTLTELETQVTDVTTVQTTQVTQITELTTVQQTLVTQLTELTTIQQTIQSQISTLLLETELLAAILLELRRARLGLSLLTDVDLQAEALQEE